eukprot:UN08042
MMRCIQRRIKYANIIDSHLHYCQMSRKLSANCNISPSISMYKFNYDWNMNNDMVVTNLLNVSPLTWIWSLSGIMHNSINYHTWFTKAKLKGKKKARAKKKGTKIKRGKL